MADVAGYHGGDGGDEPPHGHPYKMPTSCESYEFLVPGDVKMSILTTLLHYFDMKQYHNTEYWDGIKLGIQTDCANRYKDWKTKIKKHFDKEGGYDNTEGAKHNPPKGMESEAWAQVIDGLFTTSTYKNRSLKNTANISKQLYGSYHGTQSYAQRRYDKVKEGGMTQHVEGWRDMHFKGSSGWYNQLAEKHWELNKAISTSRGDDTSVDEVEVLERSLGQRRGHVRVVGRTVKSITPDLPPHMYAPAANELQQKLVEANACWAEQQ
ncbi:hypothetical protein R6Q57_001202 [Mikania cordata]